ncbi:Alpha/beta hydrolase-3 [Melia azedarach]|uniref:Alpha/beta hydrolase-3 n=1 Tax=Melia azedarach TaxID=155640 RepID=A0ACC1Y3Q2_MELAZ|nr:Alpha/beta hydrolase-3 [Melia azedarach]
MPDSDKPKTSPDLPWKPKLHQYIINFVIRSSCRNNLTVNRSLFNLVDLKSSASDKPKHGVKSSDITVDSSRNLWFRLYTPTDASPTTSLPVIVYFHGGGFAFFDANSKSYDDFCRRLARELPAVVISVNYRLAPEHRYPSPLEDGIDVLKFIDDSSNNIDCFPASADVKHCFLAGDSAGGNLVHHVAVLSNDCSFRELKLNGVIAIQPYFSEEKRDESGMKVRKAPSASEDLGHWMWTAYLPEGSDRDHPTANVFGPNAVDISSLKIPATLVVIGGFDPLKVGQKKYYEGMMKYGKEVYLIEYSDAIHGFYLWPELIESSLFIKAVKDFIESQSAK